MQCGVEIVVEYLFYFQCLFEVVVNGGGFGVQVLRCVGSVGEQDIGDVLV